MRLQIGIQFGVGRLSLSRGTVGDEFHFLLQAATDDQVILVQVQRERLTVEDFLAHTVPDQAFPFVLRRGPLASLCKAIQQGLELPLGDDNFSWLAGRVLGHHAVDEEDRSSQQEKMQQGFPRELFHWNHHHFAGVYQIGEV